MTAETDRGSRHRRAWSRGEALRDKGEQGKVGNNRCVLVLVEGSGEFCAGTYVLAQVGRSRRGIIRIDKWVCGVGPQKSGGLGRIIKILCSSQVESRGRERRRNWGREAGG